MVTDRNKPRKAQVTKRRDVRPHAELWHTANCLLKAGQERVEGSAHQFRASLVFRAFYLEALLNWLGQHLIIHWKYLERLKPREKPHLLCELLEISPNYGSAPWQIVKELFDFRNTLAHGKPETLSYQSFEDVDEYLDRGLGDFLRTPWEQFCTEENAVRARKDVEKIAKLLFDKADAKTKIDGPQSPFIGGFQAGGAQLY